MRQCLELGNAEWFVNAKAEFQIRAAADVNEGHVVGHALPAVHPVPAELVDEHDFGVGVVVVERLNHVEEIGGFHPDEIPVVRPVAHGPAIGFLPCMHLVGRPSGAGAGAEHEQDCGLATPARQASGQMRQHLCIPPHALGRHHARHVGEYKVRQEAVQCPAVGPQSVPGRILLVQGGGL